MWNSQTALSCRRWQPAKRRTVPCRDDLLAYYDARSKGGYIGLIVTEHAYISPEGKAHEGQLSVSRDTDIPGLTKLVETIHKNNTAVIAQINHAGSAATEEITGCPAISASAEPSPATCAKAKSPCAK